jgi:hypothetical protein
VSLADGISTCMVGSMCFNTREYFGRKRTDSGMNDANFTFAISLMRLLCTY